MVSIRETYFETERFAVDAKRLFGTGTCTDAQIPNSTALLTTPSYPLAQRDKVPAPPVGRLDAVNTHSATTALLRQTEFVAQCGLEMRKSTAVINDQQRNARTARYFDIHPLVTTCNVSGERTHKITRDSSKRQHSTLLSIPTSCCREQIVYLRVQKPTSQMQQRNKISRETLTNLPNAAVFWRHRQHSSWSSPPQMLWDHHY